MSSKMRWCPYAAATSLWVVTLRSGNAANGMMEVAAIGMGSRIHHAAQRVVTAAVARAGSPRFVRSAKRPATNEAKLNPITILAPVPKAAKLAL